MSDKYIDLRSFRFGLDKRRSALTSGPGTLITLTNAHINSGGEIEQRMSFAKNATAFPTDTFGLEATDSGLQTFGSDVSPSGALPTGVTYVQLAHPTGFKSVGGVATAVHMSAVLGSCNFQGKAFVIAQFDDGFTFAYYNGILVGPTRNGQVMETGTGVESLSQLATDLAAQINALPDAGILGLKGGWIAVANQDGFGNSLSGAVVVYTPFGVHMDAVFNILSTNGVIGKKLLHQNSPIVSGVAAHASFQITGGSNGGGAAFLVQAPKNQDGTGTITLANVSWQIGDTATSVANNIAAAINASDVFYGYTAIVASGAVVTVYAPVNFGNVTFPLVVTPSGDGTLATSSTVATNFSFVTNPSLAQKILTIPNSNLQFPITVSIAVSIQYTAANGTPAFTWQESLADGTAVTSANASGINASIPNGQQGNGCAFSYTFPSGGGFKSGYWKITGVDAGGAKAEYILHVILVAGTN